MVKLLMLLVLLAVLVVGVGQLGGLQGRLPADLGVREGRLRPPSPTRNSVSSQADLYPDHPQLAYARIEPLPLKPGGADQSWQALTAALAQLPGTTVVRQADGYLHATARTRWLGFVDDLEFWLDPDRGVLQLRSGSRLGREDFGVNRQRIEALRAAYLAQP